MKYIIIIVITCIFWYLAKDIISELDKGFEKIEQSVLWVADSVENK
jgi:hypothetical protein